MMNENTETIEEGNSSSSTTTCVPIVTPPGPRNDLPIHSSIVPDIHSPDIYTTHDTTIPDITTTTPPTNPIRSTSTIHHIKRTYSHPSTVLRPGIYEFDLYESFTDPACAAQTAYTMPLMNNPPPSLTVIHQCDFALDDWVYGLECLIYAWDSTTGDVWTIEVESEGSKEGTLGDGEGRVYWPLYFVVRADVWRPCDSRGAESGKREEDQYWRYRSRVESSWATPVSAKVAALGVLSQSGERWVRYETYEGGRVSLWGANVVVDAVEERGGRVFVALLKNWRVGGVDEEDSISFR